MVAELNERAAARKEYSRRRQAKDDVDFINTRNAHFNKKLERCGLGPLCLGGAGGWQEEARAVRAHGGRLSAAAGAC